MAVKSSDFATLLADLTQTQAFPPTVSTQEPLTLIQTHASAVILTDSFVYKIKKPKNFGFFDYSTPALRRSFCQQEVQLNAPFAHNIYLGIAPIVSLPSGRARFGPLFPPDATPLPGEHCAEGVVIDFAVVMKKLPETATLESSIRTDSIDLHTLEDLAQFIARFHATANTNEHISRFGDLDVLRTNWEENFKQMQPYIGGVLDHTTYEQLVMYVHTFLKHHHALFTRRIQQGYIRDCHGDLRLQHVYLLTNIANAANGLPTFALLDRIEFNERFRYGDVASEIAFLTMEMEAAGRCDLAALFTQSYVRATGDDMLQELLPFYQCYRACVRGKVQAFQLDESEISVEQRLAAEQQARTLFALAAHYAHAPVQPAVLMIGGIMGTGKSTLAQALQQTLGWACFSSDEVRKQLVRLGPAHPQADAFGQGIYQAEWTERTYQMLRQQVLAALVDGRSVLVDASFARKADREALAQEALSHNATVMFAECLCNETIALERLKIRWQKRLAGLQATATASFASDGRPELYAAQKTIWEAILPEETLKMQHIAVNTALPLSHCIEQILAACSIPHLACWLSRSASEAG